MLGRQVVDDLGRVSQIADEHHARVCQRGVDDLAPARRVASASSKRRADAARPRPAPSVIEERPSLGVVLGLRDQVQRRERRIDRGVGHDRQLARSRETVDAHDAGDLPLGLGDVRVAGSHDAVDRGHGRRPERQAPIACAPPDFTTTVAPAFRAAYRTGAGIDPSGCGGVHSTICSHAGDHRGHDGHADGRGIDGPSTGDVAADARRADGRPRRSAPRRVRPTTRRGVGGGGGRAAGRSARRAPRGGLRASRPRLARTRRP